MLPGIRILIFACLLFGQILILSCSSASPAQVVDVAPTSTPVIDVEDVDPLNPPATVVPPNELSSLEWDLNCLGPERTFPPELEPFASEMDGAELLGTWTTFLADSVIVDSNSRIKSFQLGNDGTGTWTDSELRPVLHGRMFEWTVGPAEVGERWSDVDLVLSFEDDRYEIGLPLRRRERQIVDPTNVEGLTVTEALDCGDFVPPDRIDPLPQHIWQPSPPPTTTPRPAVIGIDATAEDLLWTTAGLYAGDDFGQWVRLGPNGDVLNRFSVAPTSSTDHLFDGESLWFTFQTENQIRKFDLEGNRLATVSVLSPSKLAFDGTDIWVIGRSDATSLFRISREGEHLDELQLGTKISELEYAGERLWLGLEKEWSIASYTRQGEKVSSTYLQGKPGGLGWDGENMWVAIPSNSQVRKITDSGAILLTIDFPGSNNPDEILFDGSSVWLIRACCSVNKPGSRNGPKGDFFGSVVLRYDLDGRATGRFLLTHRTLSVVFDGENMLFGHSTEKAFTRISIDAEGPFWTPILGPFKEQEITIDAGEVIVSGTLSTPNTEGPHPLVILPPNGSSSGRDVVTFGKSKEHVRASDLLHHGYAAYRYDGRGVPGVEGELDKTVFQAASDLHAVIDSLKMHLSIDAEQISIWGQGATNLYISIVISERDDVHAAVMSLLLLGPAFVERTSPQLLNLRYTVESEADIQEFVQFYNEAVELARTGGPWDDYERRLLELVNAGRAVQSLIIEQPFMNLRFLESKRFASILEFDAAIHLESVTEMPYLLMYGGLDLIAPSSVYAPRAVEVIEKSGNPNASVIVLDKANDLWMPAQSGKFDELASIPNVLYPSFIKPGFLEMGTNWLLERTEFAVD